jgi:hypothetical protein
MKTSIISIAALAALSVSGVASAQANRPLDEVFPTSDGTVSAYRALVRTTPGGLTPLVTNTQLGRMQNGASLAVRYGHVEGGRWHEAVNNLALTAVLPAGLGASAQLTAGISTPICPGDGCDTQLLLGAGGDVRIGGTAMGSTASSPSLVVSVSGELGYAARPGGHFFSGHVGAPVTVTGRGRGLQLAGYVTPGFGFARERADGREVTGARPTVGGGLAAFSRPGRIVVGAGFIRVLTDDAENVVGINVSFGGR